MKSTRQINHINIFQTSKVFAVLTFIMMLIWLSVAAIIGYFSGKLPVEEAGEFLLGAVLFLIVSPALAFIGHAIIFWFYNLVASMTGGIEVQLKDVE